MALYSDKVMDHFMNPRNVGEIPDADGAGEIGNPVCGDMMTFYIKVKNDRLEDVKFKTFGCGAAIAVSSMVSEMAKGKTLDEAMQDHERVRRRGARGAPEEQDALLEPRRRRAPRRDRELSLEKGRSPGEGGRGARPRRRMHVPVLRHGARRGRIAHVPELRRLVRDLPRMREARVEQGQELSALRRRTHGQVLKRNRPGHSS